MTNEAINEVIARWMDVFKKQCEYCGDEPRKPRDMNIAEERSASREGLLFCESCHQGVVGHPDFCASLNALAPVPAKLTAEQWERVCTKLEADNKDAFDACHTWAQFYLTLKPRQIAAAVAEVIQAT